MEYSKRELHHERKTRQNISLLTSRLLVLVFYCMNYGTICDQYLSKSLQCYAFVGSVPVRLTVFSKNLFFIANPQVQDRAVLFHSVNKNDDEMDNITDDASSVNENYNMMSRISMIDPILVYTDIFAILIASQLMGLLDVLNDSTFWMNGGWFQPINIVSTTESSTLPIFLHRVTRNTLCYILITFTFIRGNYEISTALGSSKSILRMLLSSIAMFTFARIGILVIGVLVLTQPVSWADCIGSATNHSDQVVETVRESYFMAIAIASGRLGLYKMYNGS